jgi:hypothetical protein
MPVELLASHRGAWTGTSTFRMMPTDPFETRGGSAAVELAAGGNVTTLTYVWEHPTDGRQEGVLATWAPDSTTTDLRAVWCDSWHQQPAPMEMSGGANGSTITLDGTYGENWGWQIAIEHGSPDALRVVMRNVIPAEAATDEIGPGPYETSTMQLTRSS